MRVINRKSCAGNTRDEEVELNEVFTYVVESGDEYLLVCLHDDSWPCMGCVFDADSNHPLKHLSCTNKGFHCRNRIFKDMGQVMEDL